MALDQVRYGLAARIVRVRAAARCDDEHFDAVERASRGVPHKSVHDGVGVRGMVGLRGGLRRLSCSGNGNCALRVEQRDWRDEKEHGDEAGHRIPMARSPRERLRNQRIECAAEQPTVAIELRSSAPSVLEGTIRETAHVNAADARDERPRIRAKLTPMQVSFACGGFGDMQNGRSQEPHRLEVRR